MANKNIIGLLFSFIICNTAYSQTYLEGDKYRIGLKAGPIASTLLGDALTKSSVNYGFTGGLYYKYKLKGGFHFQTEISPAIRGARFNNTSDTGYTKFSLFYIDFAQYVLKDIKKGSHTHCVLVGAQPSVLVQSWVYNSYYMLSPAARGVKLNAMDVFAVFGYQYNKKIIGIQSVIKIGLTNINRGLNMYDDAGSHLGPTKDNGFLRNVSWETTISF